MQIPQSYLDRIEPVIAQSRAFLEKGDTLASLAFIGNIERNEIFPMVLDDSSDAAKDECSRAISRTAAMMGADFVFQVREAWMLPPKHAPRHAEILERYGSIGASPYAQDVVAFSLETTHGTWVATALIVARPPSKKRRTFHQVEFKHMPEAQGRFVGLLTAKLNEGGTLH